MQTTEWFLNANGAALTRIRPGDPAASRDGIST
jgi:hypothetical protein